MRISKTIQEKFGWKRSKKKSNYKKEGKVITYCFVSKRPVINFIDTMI